VKRPVNSQLGEFSGQNFSSLRAQLRVNHLFKAVDQEGDQAKLQNHVGRWRRLPDYVSYPMRFFGLGNTIYPVLIGLAGCRAVCSATKIEGED